MTSTTVVDPAAVVLEVLNQFSNYERWSLALKNYLVAEDLWDVVAGTDERRDDSVAEAAELKAWRKSNARDNARALRIIQNCCGAYNSNFISEVTTAKEAWKTLAEMFEPVYADIPGLGSAGTTMDDGDTRHNLSNKEESEIDSDSEKEEIEDMTDNANEHVNLDDFFNDVESGNWSTVIEFLEKNPSALRETIPNLGCTVLHHAVLNVEKEEVKIVENLVEMMKEKELEIIDDDGATALHYAVEKDNIKMAKCMVEKCKKLLSIGDSEGCLPVLSAYSWDKFDMARYLYYQTPLAALKSRSGAELISQSFSKKETDIAWHLICRCPSLVVATDYFGHSPLNALAGMRCAFLSGKRLKFWEKWIYNCIHIETSRIMGASGKDPHSSDTTIGDVRINVQIAENYENKPKNICWKGMISFRQLATSVLKLWVSGNRMYEMKSLHAQSLAFVHFMCDVAKNKDLNEMQLRFVQSAIFRAVERGHIEFVTHMLKVNPDIAKMDDANGMNMFQYAIACRQEKVYSLIYDQFSEKERRDLMEGCVDNLNNSVLHIAGRLPPYAQLDRIQDAALRMQRELQWFKEVESILPQVDGELMNITDNMTPQELFTKNHKELMKEAENSMKGTATSCTVVGALIVTMMFAAAFTVPGGNNGETGIPLFLNNKWFTIFIVSDAISLCSSTTSVIIFLGILTSRYAEVDFLKSLPTKMIFGLLTLFLSIITMMIAFYSAVYIMLKGRASGTGISVILLGCIPITTFVLMQFRLLKEMVISTYGPGIFKKKVKAA